MKLLSYTVNFEPCEEGGYFVSVPALPGCFTEGQTMEEALYMADEVIRLWIETLVKNGEEVPQEPMPKAPTQIRVQVLAPTLQFHYLKVSAAHGCPCIRDCIEPSYDLEMADIPAPLAIKKRAMELSSEYERLVHYRPDWLARNLLLEVMSLDTRGLGVRDELRDFLGMNAKVIYVSEALGLKIDTADELAQEIRRLAAKPHE